MQCRSRVCNDVRIRVGSECSMRWRVAFMNVDVVGLAMRSRRYLSFHLACGGQPPYLALSIRVIDVDDFLLTHDHHSHKHERATSVTYRARALKRAEYEEKR